MLDFRQAAGAVPAGATRARVTITLTTTLTDWNGPDAPQTGYNYATAADISLTLNQPAPAPAPLTPPSADVPGYQHVFLFYFENQDYSQVIGNTKQAPYLNSLRRRGATLTNFYAEEHPSDANYLALAGGSAFGVPLTDPEEENPLYNINAANIGDLAGSSGESWKAYLQSANGPCDDTVHGYYWNDDQPMMYFQDVRDRPRYCASHVVPLEELTGDLANPSTTPNFAWVAPDDCADMEGCGIAAGDQFLKTELTAIMNSPAWRTQRSLAIITFDEDAQDYQHPAQRVPARLGVASQPESDNTLGRVTTFGATCIPQVPPERLREVARAAEDEGLDELWLWEDCFWGGGIATAAAVLAWTSRLRVGIGVLPVPLRNVAVTAMETAALHRLFPGRVTVGVGHGVQDWMGQVGARPESPVTLLREYIEALRALLRGERVTTHGRYVHLDDVQLGWPPADAPAVLAGARGPRTLRLSGEVADGSILDRVATLEEFGSVRASIDAGRAAAGRSDPHRVVLYMGAADSADPAAIAQTIRSWAAAGADTVVVHPTSADEDPIAHIRFAAQVRSLLS